MQERISPGNAIGFDARGAEFPSKLTWNKERRERYLLRPSVHRPRSTDAMVWPSIFDTGIGPGLGSAERTRLGLDGFPLPDWIGPENPLWESLNHLRTYVASLPISAEAVQTIAITIDSNTSHSNHRPVAPHSLDKTKSEFLGYDVSDSSLLSGLSNCGYDSADLKGLRRRWRPFINEHHLFDSIEKARQFCAFTTLRVSEHAPFFVYGVWTVT